jgi:hypothetical protein
MVTEAWNPRQLQETCGPQAVRSEVPLSDISGLAFLSPDTRTQGTLRRAIVACWSSTVL